MVDNWRLTLIMHVTRLLYYCCQLCSQIIMLVTWLHILLLPIMSTVGIFVWYVL